MEPKDCGAGRHSPQIDDDGDTVCLECRRVLRVGPLGVNGFVLGGERIGFVSALACIEDDVYDADAPASSDAQRNNALARWRKRLWTMPLVESA